MRQSKPPTNPGSNLSTNSYHPLARNANAAYIDLIVKCKASITIDDDVAGIRSESRSGEGVVEGATYHAALEIAAREELLQHLLLTLKLADVAAHVLADVEVTAISDTDHEDQVAVVEVLGELGEIEEIVVAPAVSHYEGRTVFLADGLACSVKTD